MDQVKKNVWSTKSLINSKIPVILEFSGRWLPIASIVLSFLSLICLSAIEVRGLGFNVSKVYYIKF